MEEKCECGSYIPRGYGYYMTCKPIKCFNCGRINKRTNPETTEEFIKLLKKV